MSIVRRANVLIQEYQDRNNVVTLKINALKSKIRELENSTAVQYEEWSDVLSGLDRLCNPDRVDGNGMRIGIGGTAPYVRLKNTIMNIRKTAPDPSKKIESKADQLQQLVDEAKFNDERAVAATRVVMQMFADKKIPFRNAHQIIKLFRNTPPGTDARQQAEQLLDNTKYI